MKKHITAAIIILGLAVLDYFSQEIAMIPLWCLAGYGIRALVEGWFA